MKTFTLFIALSLVASVPLSAEPVLIANAKVSLATLSKREVDGILKGKIQNWSTGQRIVLATLKEGATAENILNNYASMEPDQFANHWNRLIFTGRATAPKAFAKESELVEYVAKTDYAFGYVDSKSVNASVKVIGLQ